MPASARTLRVIVTRPARDAMHWVQQLQQGGVAAEALPLIEIAPPSATASAQAQSLGACTVCDSARQNLAHPGLVGL